MKTIVPIIFFIIIICFYLTIETKYERTTSSLKDDGFLILKSTSNNKVFKYLPPNYQFLDYKYSIKGCSLSTFHRDVTSSQYVFDTKNPVYTLIRYYNKGPHISLCPGSHLTTPFLFSRPKIINGDIGDCYLFNCDLIHSGALNTYGNKRYVEQFKIAHKDDIEKLQSLNGIKSKTTSNCNINYYYEIISRKLSLLFPFLINHCFTKYLQEDDGSFINKIIIKIYGRAFLNK